MELDNLDQFIVEEKSETFEIQPGLTEIVNFSVIKSEFCPQCKNFYNTTPDGKIIVSEDIREEYRSVIAFHVKKVNRRSFICSIHCEYT